LGRLVEALKQDPTPTHAHGHTAVGTGTAPETAPSSAAAPVFKLVALRKKSSAETKDRMSARGGGGGGGGGGGKNYDSDSSGEETTIGGGNGNGNGSLTPRSMLDGDSVMSGSNQVSTRSLLQLAAVSCSAYCEKGINRPIIRTDAFPHPIAVLHYLSPYWGGVLGVAQPQPLQL